MLVSQFVWHCVAVAHFFCPLLLFLSWWQQFQGAQLDTSGNGRLLATQRCVTRHILHGCQTTVVGQAGRFTIDQVAQNHHRLSLASPVRQHQCLNQLCVQIIRLRLKSLLYLELRHVILSPAERKLCLLLEPIHLSVVACNACLMQHFRRIPVHPILRFRYES